MGFNFNFEWPPYVGQVIGILGSLLVLLGALAGGLLMLRRLILAWRSWGRPEALGAFASRAELLNEDVQLVGLQEGKPIGRVADVILDLRTGRAAGFRVRRLWKKRLLPFERVKSIGRDAITVDSAADLQLPDALPALAALAAAKYRWEDCEAVTESGLKLGKTSWRHLWYNRTDGSVELEIECFHASPINTMLAWAIDLVSMMEPFGDWIAAPGGLSVRVPLRTVRSASRRMLILNTEGEAQFQEMAQKHARRTRENFEISYGKLKEFMRRRRRGSTPPPSAPALGASVALPQAPNASHEEPIAARTDPADS